MSKKKRSVGRPRIVNSDRYRPVQLRNNLVKQMDAEIEKHSKLLGFTINRQQFIEMLLNNWRDK